MHCALLPRRFQTLCRPAGSFSSKRFVDHSRICLCRLALNQLADKFCRYFLQTSTIPGSSHARRWYWCRGFRQIDEAIDCHGSDSPQPVMQANFRPNSVCSQRESVHQTEFWKDLLSLALGSTSALVSLCLKVATAGCMKFRHQLIILSVHGLCQGCALSRWQTGTVWWC